MMSFAGARLVAVQFPIWSDHQITPFRGTPNGPGLDETKIKNHLDGYFDRTLLQFEIGVYF